MVERSLRYAGHKVLHATHLADQDHGHEQRVGDTLEHLAMPSLWQQTIVLLVFRGPRGTTCSRSD